MSKLRTVTQLCDCLDQEISWRRKELITLKLLHDKARDHQAVLLRRAGIALLYAHWEGFVKAAGTSYVEFVARQGLRFGQLTPNFIAIGMKGKLSIADDTVKGQRLVEIATFFAAAMNEKANIPWTGAVQTKSNLSPERLRDIITVLGMDYHPFELKERAVVERLVRQRNLVGHGHYLDVDKDEYTDLHRAVLDMIDEFKGQLDIAATTQSFRATL